MKQLIWYAEYITIERNGTRHTYALRQVSSESMRRLWAARDQCTMTDQNFYCGTYTWRAA